MNEQARDEGGRFTADMNTLIRRAAGRLPAAPAVVAAERPDGLHGGARMPREDASGDPNATMNAAIRVAAGRQPEYRRGSNGVSYPVGG